MDFLLNLFEFVATCMWILFWCIVAGFACWLIAVLLREVRCYYQRKTEEELIEAWHKRNQVIAGACQDLDHPDELQRTLAESFINTMLP